MGRVCGLTSNEMMYVEVLDASRRQTSAFEGLEHCRMVGRLIDVRVLAFHIEHDGCNPRGLRSVDQRCDSCRLTATGCTDHGGVAGQNGLLSRVDSSFHVLV